MTDNRPNISDLFERARHITDPIQRKRFFEEVCGVNAALRARLVALLHAYEEAGDFLRLTREVDHSGETRESGGTLSSAADTYIGSIAEGPGSIIGPYKLLELIGEGGFGSVYVAEQDRPIRRKVALKIIKLGMDTRQVVARFEAERQALAMMEHPNIARVFDGGSTETGRPYFVMELVKGVSITRYCDENGLTPQQRLELFVPVCQAVQHAHQKGVIHRDLKPSNVLVSRHDERPMVKVIDFGIAKAAGGHLTDKTLFTELRQMIGTPAYMSPEQAGLSDLDVDTRSDIYSLGVLLYELLTGTTPFDIKTLLSAGYAEIQRVIREVEPQKPSTRISTYKHELPSVAAMRKTELTKLARLVQGDLDWIVMKCLEKDRTRRYETVNGLAADIQRYLGGEAVLAAPPSAAYRLQKLIKRNKGPVVAASVLLVVLIAGIIGTTSGLLEAQRARRAETDARIDAQQQAEIAREVNQFLTEDLLSAVDPTRTANRQITVREVVDEAARRIEHRFENSPQIGGSIEKTLGQLYARLAVFDRAQHHLQRAYELFRRALGETARATLDVRGSIDDVIYQTGRFEEGIKSAEESIKVMLSALGPDDRITLADQSRLATMYAKQIQFDRADRLHRDTWERQKRVLGPAHRDTLGTVNNFAMSYMERQQFDKAEPLLSDALSALCARVGEEDPDALEVAINLGWTNYELGQAEKAENMTAKALEAARRVMGNDHPVTQLAVNNLGVIYVRTGRFTLAEPLYREGLEVTRRTLGPDHPDMLPSLSNLGKLYGNNLKQYDKAEPLLAEAAEKARKICKKGDFKLGAILVAYGDCLLGLKRPSEAVRILLEANESLMPVLKPEHPAVQKSFRLLATAYSQVGDESSAAMWRVKVIEGPAKPGNASSSRAELSATSAPAITPGIGE